MWTIMKILKVLKKNDLWNAKKTIDVSVPTIHDKGNPISSKKPTNTKI